MSFLHRLRMNAAVGDALESRDIFDPAELDDCPSAFAHAPPDDGIAYDELVLDEDVNDMDQWGMPRGRWEVGS